MSGELEKQLEIEELAKQLFDRENPDPDLDWDSTVGKIVSGASVSGGVSDEVKDNYRARAAQILRDQPEHKDS
ncbi:hypothetical protein [Ochrobactrum soli]|uniref:Uncharacterized protein n=1 Tax=Ochrobactrum soli TaxID=2448455 RepID=A0A849KV13_9HYPH|nr:hypothetical protein [[Ochrobactrum] soli]NNU62709.1 hypothetical protein [[Ochrobactrum] soli]